MREKRKEKKRKRKGDGRKLAIDSSTDWKPVVCIQKRRNMFVF